MPYEMPPDELAAIVDAPLTPSVSLDPTKTMLLLMHRPGSPSIDELSQPELRLAGLRIDPVANGPSRSGFYNGLTLKRIADGEERVVSGLPDHAKIGQVHWSPDGKHFAFSITDNKGIALWLADVDTGVARVLSNVKLNKVFGGAIVWLPDSTGLLVRAVCEDRGDPPQGLRVPDGPVIQENAGTLAPSRT